MIWSRCVILGGSGKNFTSGLDLMDHTDFLLGSGGEESSDEKMDVARQAMKMKSFIEGYQNSFTAIENCPKPVIAAVQNACIGAGVDMVCISFYSFYSINLYIVLFFSSTMILYLRLLHVIFAW
jgi:enoyl-CoA hydratase/carnithine racemase